MLPNKKFWVGLFLLIFFFFSCRRVEPPLLRLQREVRSTKLLLLFSREFQRGAGASERRLEDLLELLEANDPLNPELKNAKGLFLLKKEKYEEADLQFRLALEGAPRAISAKVNLALVRFFRGFKAESEQILVEVLRSDPLNSRARYLRAWITSEDRGGSEPRNSELRKASILAGIQ